MDREQKRPGAATDSGELRQDLLALQPKEDALNRCKYQSNQPGDGQVSAIDCPSEQLLNFQVSHDGEPGHEIPILHLPGSAAFFFASGMTIDADGAPNAYHPENTGLDDLSNAGAPGNWQGLAKDRDGEPFVQGPNDPFPGYYVSATALSDRNRAVNDPLRYLDSTKIPYIVLPGGMARQMGARPGDFAVVLNRRNGMSSYAIFGDVGPQDRIGEGSMALAENLGIRSDARMGGTRRGILYLIFPKSGNGQPRTVDEIKEEGERLFQGWGGPVRLAACADEQPPSYVERNQNTN